MFGYLLGPAVQGAAKSYEQFPLNSQVRVFPQPLLLYIPWPAGRSVDLQGNEHMSMHSICIRAPFSRLQGLLGTNQALHGQKMSSVPITFKLPKLLKRYRQVVKSRQAGPESTVCSMRAVPELLGGGGKLHPGDRLEGLLPARAAPQAGGPLQHPVPVPVNIF